LAEVIKVLHTIQTACHLSVHISTPQIHVKVLSPGWGKVKLEIYTAVRKITA